MAENSDELPRSLRDDRARQELKKALRQVARAHKVLTEVGADDAVARCDDALDALEEAQAAYIGGVQPRATLALQRALDLVRGTRTRSEVG